MRTKENKTFLLKQRTTDEGIPINYKHEIYTRPNDSQFHTFVFSGISTDAFIDLTMKGDFWKFPCAVDLFSSTGNYHSLHFDAHKDFHQFFRGWKMAVDDIRIVDKSPIPYSWLYKKLPSPESCSEDDLKYCIKNQFFDNLEPGDEIWEYDNKAWDQLAGRKGYAIVRKGIVVKQLLTAMN